MIGQLDEEKDANTAFYILGSNAGIYGCAINNTHIRRKNVDTSHKQQASTL